MAKEENAESVESAGKPKRGLVFGVGGLILVVLVGGAWWLNQQRLNAAESQARAKLKELESFATLDVSQKHVASLMVRKNIEQAMPEIAKLHHMVHVDLSGTDFGDQHAKYLAGLRRLNSATLSNTKITEAGLQELQSLPLSSLLLKNTPIGPAAVDVLSGMSTLEILDLEGTNVADNLMPLEKLDNLEWLVLTRVDLSKISSDGIDALTKIPQLRRLTLIETQIQEDAASKIKSARPSINVEVTPAEQSMVPEAG